jgi:hypothetical protein
VGGSSRTPDSQLLLRGPTAPCNNAVMVRPESSIGSAGVSPVRVSAGAPGSRPRSAVGIPPAERGVESLCQEGAPKRAATVVKPTALSHDQPKGVREGRAAHVTAKATDSGVMPEPPLGLPGVGGAARFEGSVGDRRDLPRRPRQAKTGRIRRDAENVRSREGGRGVHSTGEPGEKPGEGRDPAWVARSAGVSARAWA